MDQMENDDAEKKDKLRLVEIRREEQNRVEKRRGEETR